MTFGGGAWILDEVAATLLRESGVGGAAKVQFLIAVRGWRARSITLLELEQVGASLGLDERVVWNVALGFRETRTA